MGKYGIVTSGIALVLAGAIWVVQAQRANRLRVEIRMLETQVTAAELYRQENRRLAEQAQTNWEQAEANVREVMRLRALVSAMQRQQAEEAFPKAGQGNVSLQPLRHPTEVPERQPYHYTQQQAALFIERLNFGKRLGLALRRLAEENNGELPVNIAAAARWLSTNSVPIEGDTGPLYGVGANHFELVYTGRLGDLENPDRTIMAREKQPVEVHAERWTKMYVFADGSVQRLEATTAEGFAPREKELWPTQPQH